MALSIDDMREWLAILRDHPEWKAEVRREVLSEELLSLPDLVRQNGEDIRALREVVAQNSVDIRQNSIDIQALKEVVAQNSADIQALKEVVAQNSADIRTLTEKVSALTDRMDNFVGVTIRLDGRLGAAEGSLAESHWVAKYTGRFGRLATKARIINPDDLDAFYLAWDEGRLTDEDAAAVRALDILISGVEGKGAEKRQVLLAVEISIRIEQQDVERAVKRAEILRRLGYHTVPVVAGALIDPQLEAFAREQGVRVLLRPSDIAYALPQRATG
jgi:hypothetical protein